MLKGIGSLIILLISINSGYCAGKNDYRIAAAYIPYFDSTADIDPNELNGGVLFNHELKEGEAFGLKFSSIDDRYSETDVLSVVYYQGRQKEEVSNESVRSHTLYFEGGKEYNYSMSKEVRSFGAFLLGVGAVKFDFRRNKSHEWGGAFEAGIQIGVKVASKLKASIGASYYLWGYPTETIGYGALLAAEVGVEF